MRCGKSLFCVDTTNGKIFYQIFLKNIITRSSWTKPVYNTEKTEKLLLDTVFNGMMSNLNTKFETGDNVRISKIKVVFDKCYQPNWYTEILQLEEFNLPIREHI